MESGGVAETLGLRTNVRPFQTRTHRKCRDANILHFVVECDRLQRAAVGKCPLPYRPQITLYATGERMGTTERHEPLERHTAAECLRADTVNGCAMHPGNNIRHRKPLPVYGKGENVRDWLYVEDHARAIDLIFHEGKVGETYNIGGFNEWKNIDLIKVLINTVDRLLGRKEGEDMDLITYVTDRAGHDLRYAIDSSKLQRELGWEPSLQFEEGIEKTVRWYLDHQEWLDHVTSGNYQKYYEEYYGKE